MNRQRNQYSRRGNPGARRLVSNALRAQSCHRFIPSLRQPQFTESPWINRIIKIVPPEGSSDTININRLFKEFFGTATFPYVAKASLRIISIKAYSTEAGQSVSFTPINPLTNGGFQEMSNTGTTTEVARIGFHYGADISETPFDITNTDAEVAFITEGSVYYFTIAVKVNGYVEPTYV